MLDHRHWHDHDQGPGHDHDDDDRGHGHAHPHDHLHDHGDEQHLSGAGTGERAFGGPVTVDVGDGAGALVLLLDDDWLEDEVHLRPVSAGASPTRPPTHTGVWVRRVPSGDVVAAVFGSLPTGAYAVLDHDRSTVLAEVTIDDGGVVELDLRGRAAG